MRDEIDQILLSGIPTRPLRTSTPDLSELLDRHGHVLGARALQKRLTALANEHAIERHDASKPHQWSWPKGQKEKIFPRMAPHEALSLLLAREHLHALLPPPTLRWIDDRLAKSESEVSGDPSGRTRSWREKVRRVSQELPRFSPRVDARVFKQVSEALYEGLMLSFQYTKRFAHEPKAYVVHPLGLCEREGELWLAARKHEGDAPRELRFFLLHRMLGADVLRGRPAAKAAKTEFADAIAEGMAHFPLELGSSVALVARFDERVIEKLHERPIAKDQRTEPLPGGWVRLRATIPHTRALHAFLLSYGPLCVVESPSALRTMIAEELRDAARAYETR